MIQKFADWLVYGIFGLEAKSHLGEAVNFFFYDTVKIILLLFLISVVMGVVNAYLPIGRLRHYLTTRRLYGLEYVFAALFGSDNAILSHAHPFRYSSASSKAGFPWELR